jgi:predicted tellurium resistance membrane protein TerC
MIFVGAALINRFHWIIYIFGAFLVYTGIKMFRQEELDIQPEDNPLVRPLPSTFRSAATTRRRISSRAKTEN